MKIVLLMDSFGVGGAQRQLCTLAKALHAEHDVHVLVYHPNTSYLEEELKSLGIAITKIEKQSRFDVLHIAKLLRFYRRNKFDLSISFLDTPNFYNELAKLFRVVPHIIVSQRSAYFQEDLSLKKKLLENLHVVADAVTTNSISQAQRMAAYFPILKEKIVYMPNTYKFYNSFETKFQNKNRFIVLSNLKDYKNPLNLCRAVKAYKELYGRVDFIINWYGRYPVMQHDIENFERAKAIIDENDLNPYINFCGNTEKPYDKIIEHDALIHVSDFEGCSNSVCEAMALEKPVILSNVCDHSYFVSRENGLLVDPEDPEDIAQNIHAFIEQDEDTKRAMGTQSRSYIIENMSYEMTLDRWKKLLNAVTGKQIMNVASHFE